MKNKKYTYDEILSLLRENSHTAPDGWNELELNLDINTQVNNLPTYKAPDLWSNIESELDETTLNKEESVNDNKHLLYLKIASIIILLMAITIAYLLTQNMSDREVQYRSEIETATLINDEVDIDTDLENIMLYIESNASAYTKEELMEFQNQLAEIMDSIEDIIELQNTYGGDESSMKLLASMEREKSDLLKSFIEKAS
jgi:hypothetical protein